MKSSKISPMQSSTSTVLAVLSSPEANQFIQDQNKDIDFENDKIMMMDNIAQVYTEEEDAAIESALGKLSGMDMAGAIPFTNFSTTLSTTRYMKGFYNYKEGDIYVKSAFTIRGDHSQVAARLSNHYYKCRNPAFGKSASRKYESQTYVEIANDHSAINCDEYKFPSPLTNREIINNVLWKRLGEKSILVVFHPLTSHPLVENKDGGSMIRASVNFIFRITQLDDDTTEVESGVHINFGGNLPKAVVHRVLIPNFNRVYSHYQAYFANSIKLDNLRETDGKLMGELLVYQIKQAKKRGGWKKRAELGNVGVDEFLYISVAMRELLPLRPWLRALLHEISLNKVKVAPTVHTALSDMKDHDAINLAKGLSTIILSNTEAAAAVDHWIAQNAALEEFEKEYAWMRPFFAEVAQYNLNTSNFGLRLRGSRDLDDSMPG
ncbi:hypothetical protein TL16_g11056 [Triparma laevis f. inornata]|uniref:Uncharacterized protein n=1 Tax=Triparma laevis f. inornata TaxID=1714386 RepID=A0A9W7EPF5_9STRA|nr:hypothetical protein TL16_g11056 [Triparma laevis f. inornata]